MKIKYIVMFIGVMFVLGDTYSFARGTSDSSGKRRDAKKLIVGMELQFPPFETIDKNGNPTGFTVDFSKALANALGRELEIKNIRWTGLIPAVQLGKVDIVISSMSVTEERKKSVDFTEPYGTWYIVSLLKKDSPVKKFSNLNSKKYTIALKTGTVAEVIAKQHLPNAKVAKFDSWDTIVLEIAQGRADAGIYDPISVYKGWKKYPNTTRPLFEPIDGFSNPIAGAMKKGNTVLKEQINQFIKQAKSDSTIAKISKKYLGDMNKVIKTQGAPPFFE